MEKIFLIIGLIIIIFFLVSVVFLFCDSCFSLNNKDKEDRLLSEDKISNEIKSDIGDLNSGESGSSGGVSSSSSGAGGGSGGTSSQTDSSVNFNSDISNFDLPEDIEIKPCGFYYSEYGFCGGNCFEGECINDERSCYCKKN